MFDCLGKISEKLQRRDGNHSPPPLRFPVRPRVNLMYFMFHIVGSLGLNPVFTFLLAEWLTSAETVEAHALWTFPVLLVGKWLMSAYMRWPLQ